MDRNLLLAHAMTCEHMAAEIQNDSTRVRWFLHQAKNFRRMAEGIPEPKADSHHTQFHWLEGDHNDR